MPRNAIDWYLHEYPQLTLPVERGMSAERRYLDIVRYGVLPEEPPDNPFSCTDEDERQVLESPVGPIQVLYLADRGDFERFVQVFSGRCEPIAVPPTMGAVTFFGVRNWREVDEHRRRWEEERRPSWPMELLRVLSDPTCFADVIVLVSKGGYSALSAADAGYPEAEWLRVSRVLRTYHEATHVTCRKRWPSHREAIRDEVVADCVGLLASTGGYDAGLARRFLGVGEGGYVPGGRLENYVAERESLDSAVGRARVAVEACERVCAEMRGAGPFDVLARIEDTQAGMTA
jgi:hypothetical protein